MRADVVVVGGGLAAIRTCVELRSQGFLGSIVLVSDESRLPYDRPPLSKAALHDHVDTTLPHDVAELDVQMLTNTKATGLNTDACTVGTDAGDVEFASLVIATGASPVRLPGPGPQHTLRDPDDAALLRRCLDRGGSLVIAGAGWIGAELATAAVRRGCTVHCVEAADLPLATAFGHDVAAALKGWWAPVDLRTGSTVRSVEAGGVALDSGEEIAAEVVVSAVGVRPNTGWITDSVVTLDRGVRVDDGLRSSVQNVFAVGDVAARWSPRYQRRLAGGHWADAAEAPAVVAATIIRPDVEHSYDPVPYFWSDQFGHKLQLVGVRHADDTPVWRSGHDGVLQGVAWLGSDGTLRAYLAIDRPRDMLHARFAIAADARPDPACLADVSVAVRSA